MVLNVGVTWLKVFLPRVCAQGLFPFGSFLFTIVRSLVTVKKGYCVWKISGE